MYDLERIKSDILKLETNSDISKENVFGHVLDGVHDFLEERMNVDTDELIYAVSFYLIHSKDGEAIKRDVATALQRTVANEKAALLYNQELISLQCALDNQREL